MSRSDVTVMLCPQCRERFNVLREWRGKVKCPVCDVPLEGHPEEAERPAGFAVQEPVGQTIGGCRIQSVLGRGTMGAVYRALHTGLQREVAVKMLPVTPQNRPILKRLVFEARTIAKLEHPNIVQVYDVGIQAPYLFIVMQLVRGVTLAERIRQGLIVIEEAVAVIKQVAKGLVAAHGRGVIHRDLKPENIMLTEDGTVKIMDFGLARDVESFDELSGHVVGTPYYIAPEVWLNQKFDERSDLYSLGAVFYYMVCGRRLFDAGSLSDLMRCHLKVLPAPPKDVNKAVSEPLSAIIMKLLAKEPARRYSSARAFLHDLEAYERGDEVQALMDFKKFVKCRFCDTLNPPNVARCRICGEDLRPSVVALEIAIRDNEFKCRNCGMIVEKGRKSCPTCSKPFCHRCLVRIAVLGSFCEYCASANR